MRRFYITSFTVILMFALSACVGEASGTSSAPAEISDAMDGSPDNPQTNPGAEAVSNITYTYEGYFTVELPASWENKYSVEENEFGPVFINTSNRDAGWSGTLFSIIGYDSAEWEEQKTDILAAIGSHLTELGGANGKMFVLVTPGDVNYNVNDETLMNEYEEMISGIETIAASFSKIDIADDIPLSVATENSSEESGLFNGLILSEDSAIEVNWEYEGGIGSAGHEYKSNEIDSLAEKKEEVLTLSVNGSIENNVEISSLDFLADFENLRMLSFSNCHFSNSNVLPKAARLEAVDFYRCNLADFDLLENNPHITTLTASYNEVSDISALEKFTDLTQLSLIGNQVSDLSPISNAKKLESISLLDGNYEIKSLKPLYELENLKSIQLNDAVRVNLPQEELDFFGYGNPEGILEID